MLRQTQIFLSRDLKDALRREAKAQGLQTPEEVLEAILSEWLKQRPHLAEWLRDRAEALAAVDKKHSIVE